MKKIIFASLILVLVVLVGLGAAPVMAASSTTDGQRLENLLKREQILLTNQQARLQLANQIVTKAGEWIEKLKSEGKDTSSLESALGDYKTAVAKAAPFLDQAASILNAKAGFDSSGKVTDRAQATKTIKEAGRAERQFHLTITPAALELREALLTYRQSNK